MPNLTENLRLELEAEVRHRTAQLQAANQALQSLIDASPQAIVSFDLNRQVQSWNKAAEKIFGWRADEIVGKELPFTPIVGKEHEHLFDRALQGQSVENIDIHRHRRDGASLDLLVSITLVRATSGSPSGYLVLASDVTEQRTLERQLFRAQRLESVGTLASGIVHDLNNILTPILMSIQLLRGRLGDASSENNLAMLVETSAERAATLVKQVLTFARGLEGDRVPVQLPALLFDVEKIMNSTLPKSIRVITDIPGRFLRPVLADATQLHQVFMNLCVNARDAMPRGGTLSIAASNVFLDETYMSQHEDTGKTGSYVLIEIADTGTGIPPEIVDRIFDPFFTTKDSNKGTGLGLSTVDAIVKNHGGFVRVYSETNKGTSFKVYLPALPGAEAEKSENRLRNLPAGHGELVLIVDDEAAMREVTKVTLENFGYRVITAANGAEGVGVFAKQSSEIKVVISDMNMPVMDGAAMILALRSIDPAVRVLSTSGLPQTGSDRPSGFLNKPYTAEQLLQALHEMLQ